ncbi:MAG: hypothetical protein H0X42_12115 [Solirubrobacterales bacterium]|nr:hypothetical protein [Solirubrobacterales bacterium]
MGRGRARVGVAGAIAAFSLLAAGCGAESHPNEQRPAAPTRVSVTIARKAISVQPGLIGDGPDRSQQIPQNQNHRQPPIKTRKPLDVIFVTANQTATDSHLLIHGPRDTTSPPVPANSPGTFQANLPAGTYTITVAEQPEAKAGKLVVGHYRASSENDVLLP